MRNTTAPITAPYESESWSTFLGFQPKYETGGERVIARWFGLERHTTRKIHPFWTTEASVAEGQLLLARVVVPERVVRVS